MGTEPTTNFDVEALNALGARPFRWRRQRRRSRDGADICLEARACSKLRQLAIAAMRDRRASDDGPGPRRDPPGAPAEASPK
jgi:hypothetical protein